MAFALLIVIALIGVLSPIYASTGIALAPCTGYRDYLKFYHDYTEPECPNRFHLKGNDCEETDPINPLHKDKNHIDVNVLRGGGFCDSYCQIKTSYSYGTEQPIDTQPLCRGPTRCAIADTEIVSYSWREKPVGPAGWKAHVINIAIDDGYAPPLSGNTQRRGTDNWVYLVQNQCAYWTFIPIIRNSCGTYTLRDTVNLKGTFIPKSCQNPRSTPNFCISQPVQHSPAKNEELTPRNLFGLYTLIEVDCYTGQKLLSSLENEWLSKPGVALPDDSPYTKTLQKFWKDSAPFVWKTADQIDCNGPVQDRPVAADCVDAIDSLRKSADMIFSSHELTVVSRFGACAVHAQLNKKANIPDCQVTYLEIAIAADRGRRSCEKRPFARCPVYPLWDKGNDCNGWVTFTGEEKHKCW